MEGGRKEKRRKEGEKVEEQEKVLKKLKLT